MKGWAFSTTIRRVWQGECCDVDRAFSKQRALRLWKRASGGRFFSIAADDEAANTALAWSSGDVIPLKPNIVVLDLTISGNAYEAISKIVGECPDTKIVVFTGLVGVESALQALEIGASGFVSKGSAAAELGRALRSVAGGETYITQSFATQVIAALQNSALRKRAAAAIKLSLREEQIVRLLLRGKTNKEIANQLSISEKTVKHYMTILMQKMNARNRIEVVLAAQSLAAADQGSSIGRYRN